MSAVPNEQWLRRCSVILLDGSNEALEMSDLHVIFETKQEDEESPNNANIRIENLSADIVHLVQESYQRVIVQAGYWSASFGVVFDGQIKQFRKGRTDAKTTFLEILAADGDLAYNYAMLRQTLASSNTPEQRVNAIISAMTEHGVVPGQIQIPGTGGILPRGKVLFGLAKAAMRQVVRDRGATWNISGGAVNVTPLDGYLPGEAVVLNSATGLIGRPEQTENGVRARCLINPRIIVGGLVQIDQAAINRTEASSENAIPNGPGQIPYDRYVGVQMLADVTADGIYRVYVAEISGDTRGQDWYMDLILLAIDPVSKKVTAE